MHNASGMKMEIDLRKFHRIDCEILFKRYRKCDIYIYDGNRELDVYILDLSPKGARLEIDELENMELSKEDKVLFQSCLFCDQLSFLSGQEGDIRWVDGRFFGVEFSARLEIPHKLLQDLCEINNGDF